MDRIKARRDYYDRVMGDKIHVTGFEFVAVGRPGKDERYERWCRTSDGLLVHPDRLITAEQNAAIRG